MTYERHYLPLPPLSGVSFSPHSLSLTPLFVRLGVDPLSLSLSLSPCSSLLPKCPPPPDGISLIHYSAPPFLGWVGGAPSQGAGPALLRSLELVWKIFSSNAGVTL